MSPGRARRRGKRHRLVDRSGAGQRIGLDGERAHLFDERADGARGHHAFRLAARRVAEQPHRGIETVVGRASRRGMFQSDALPDLGLAAGAPRAVEHVLRFAGGQTAFVVDGRVDHLPQIPERLGLGVWAQHRGDGVEHSGRVAFQQQDVHRADAERGIVVIG